MHLTAGSDQVMARPGTFPPGRSGNPAGRPRGIEARCREFTEDAIAALVAALQNPRERVQAAAILLDRGWGKAPQTVQGQDAEPFTVLHLLAAREVSQHVRKILIEKGATGLPEIEGDAEPNQPIDLMRPALE
jgi:hypothetical protein